MKHEKFIKIIINLFLHLKMYPFFKYEDAYLLLRLMRAYAIVRPWHIVICPLTDIPKFHWKGGRNANTVMRL